MKKKRLKLPIGIQTFEKLRQEGYVYVDKTKYLIELIEQGQIYFLARPRRFGKSLTISTFDALFSGKKELFKGLYAEEFVNCPQFKPSPVIRLDMSEITTDEGIEGIKESILRLTREVARNLGIELSDTELAGHLLGYSINLMLFQNILLPLRLHLKSI
jgi:predicted methyltransferase